MTTTTYEFSAFTEADLLAAGAQGHGVSCGDTFTMPAGATTCIEVTDNDRFLSGDNYCNENANDHYGQNATITGENGNELGNGGQIYAEKYFWVCDDAGNWYVMIEIEQEGSGEDYFTFYTGNGYTVPEEGTELTVYSSRNVKGDWIDFKDLDAGEKGPDTGSISGRVFNDEDCDGIDGGVTVIEGSDYTIEAEDMDAWGFKTVQGAYASGGELVKLQCAGQSAAIKTDFQGKDGVYDVSLFIQDETDGKSKIKLLVNGQVVEAIRLDRQSDGVGSNNGGFSEFVVEGVELKAGDEVKIWAEGNGYEFVRIDKLEFNGRDQEIRTEEPGKEGVVVVLLDANGDEVLDGNGDRIETVTDANGEYTFDGVPVGDYRVKFENPDGTEFTFQNVGSDDAIDSDVNGNGVSDVISVVADQTTSDVDAGLKPVVELGSIAGRYFCDENRDGVETDGAGNFEAGVAGATVWLLQGGAVIASTTTDSNGDYIFEGLEAGDYSVRFEDPADVSADTEGKAFIAANQGDDAVDSDVVNVGGAGNGNTATITLAAGENKTDIDAGIEDQPGSLSGTYFCDENRDGDDDGAANGDADIAGKMVMLFEADGVTPATDIDGNPVAAATTDANGDYSFENLAAGDYVVMFEATDGKSFIPANAAADDVDSDVVDAANGKTAPVTVNAGEETKDVDAGVSTDLGSLSGRYFCDVDGDGLDNDGDTGGEGPGVEGILVTLLDANGNPVLDANNQPVTTQTGPNGGYSFSLLVPGIYGVSFAETPVDKEFTAANVGNDDTIDSDAIADDFGGAAILGIEVVGGQDTPDNDAGVTTSNADPNAEDVAAAVCADDMAVINLIDSVSDPDGDTISIISISDADETANVGEFITLDNGGGRVTLNADGTVSFDPNGAYDDLEIRESVMDQFQFTASDGNGGTDTANADIKVCGALNTAQTISDSLPETGCITFDGLDTDTGFFGTISNSGDARLDGLAVTGMFCLDQDDNFPTFGDKLDGTFYSTLDDIPDGVLFAEENLDNLNWLLNQDPTNLAADFFGGPAADPGETYEADDIQEAVWLLMQEGEVDDPTTPEVEGYTTNNADAIELFNAALAMGDDFVPQEGDVFGVVFEPLDSTIQPFFVPVEFDNLTQDCDCVL